MGNCGVGFAPCRTDADSRDFLLSLVEAVEDIPNEDALLAAPAVPAAKKKRKVA